MSIDVDDVRPLSASTSEENSSAHCPHLPLQHCPHTSRFATQVGALCVAHALEDMGEAEILAVVHGTGLKEGVGA
eukprot:2019427-Prymnesium_polylepis.1